MSLKESIDKATSAELTEDDFALLLDVVDIVKSDADTNIEEAVNIIRTKLESNNANVILRSVSLLDFLAENCGAMMRGQIAKRSFVNNYLVKLVNDPKMHNSIKYAVIKEIYKLSKSFKGDESLRAMEDSFKELQKKYLYLCQQAVSEVDGTPKPAGGDEDEELRKAIEMSLRETGPPFGECPGTSVAEQPLNVPAAAPEYAQTPAPAPAPAAVPAPEKVRALYDLQSNDDDTLSFKKDDIIVVVEKVNDDWIRGSRAGRADHAAGQLFQRGGAAVETDRSQNPGGFAADLQPGVREHTDQRPDPGQARPAHPDKGNAAPDIGSVQAEGAGAAKYAEKRGHERRAVPPAAERGEK
ncbi:hypothetical protein KL919_004248 [Ogataea angusta]|nr:hypothetical protein KL943_000050 [Ogataea angusta]KAG7856718.1 hypothetical protein KL919_004248 [Ogataea angusta]